MAWNEPGGQKDKDPWGSDQAPPDLDEAFRKFKEKFSGKKGGSGGSNNGAGKGGELPSLSGGLIGILLVVLLVLWAALGIYQVNAQERAVVLRFGQYVETVGPGLHWNPPIIDSVHKINTTKVRSTKTHGLMLTEDDNIVDITLSTQYIVIDPKAFLLEVRDPELSLVEATESALRHVVGSSSLHNVLTEGRVEIAFEVRERLQNYLNLYHTGIEVSKVNIEDAQPPSDVQAAFDDVIRAKEDKAKIINQAQTYKNGVVPEARGEAQRMIESAKAYRGQVIAAAEGEASRFTQLLAEYKQAPAVTRERLYIDAIENVLKQSSKVLVDTNNNNLLYLPLDQLMKAQQNKTSASSMSQEPITNLDQPITPPTDFGRVSNRAGR